MKQLRTISGISVACIFTLFALVQYNDPDPLIWISIYMTVAGVGVYSLFRSLKAALILPVVGIFLCASYMQWPHTYYGISMPMSYKPEIEEARESLGLLIGALSLGWLYVVSYLFQKSQNVKKSTFPLA